MQFFRVGCSLVFIALFAFTTSFAQNKGPGGVGTTNGAGTLRAWWRGDAGVTSSSGQISSWADQSGYGSTLSQSTSARRPTAVASSTNLNGQPVVQYTAANAQYFTSAFSGPNTSNFTLFLVANGTSYQSLFRFQNSGGTFVVYPWEQGGGRDFISSSDGGTGSGIASGLVNSVNNVGVARYRRSAILGMQTFRNGALSAQRDASANLLPNEPFFSGIYNPGTSEYPNAEVGELIMYYTGLNDAQMAIVENYLAAKYNVSLSSIDYYTMDDPANGNYDFDVAGIGRTNASNVHNDATGTGFIRIQNPSDLGNGEYFIWGRDNGAAQATNTSDIPGGVSARFARTWRVSEVGEVGTVDLDIDVTGLTDFSSLSTLDIVGKLRLLVDTDNDGLFNDETPIFGATSVGSNVYRFSTVSKLNTNLRFTFALGQAQTYYSLGSGSWEDNTKWSLSADGSSGALPAGVYPTRIDNVVINTGHNITVNSITDNGSAGVKPDDLGQSNIGPFGSSNLSMFYQTGNIAIKGTLTVSGVEVMLGGYTWIQTGGTLTTGSNFVVTGNLQADSGSALSTFDDIVLTGFSTTVINTASTSSDDLIIDHTDATLCGTGTETLTNGSGSAITYANSGSVSQVCTSFTINCTGTGCTGFPVVGTTVVITGYTGPAGVGSNIGDSQLKLWFRVDNGVNVTTSLVNSWTNSAGISALDISESGTQRPTLVANATNGFSEVSFAAVNRLRSGQNLTTSNFITNQASTFTVNRADNTTQQSTVYMTDPLDANRFSNHIPWAGTVYYDIGQCCGNDARLDVASLTNLNQYSIWSYDADPTNGKTLYRNGTSLLNRALTSTFTNHANYRFNIGGNTTGAAGYEGDVTEVIIYNNRINTAERIIIQNYLSAKYNIALTANDVYTQDNSGNGNFDFDVAGIGRASDATYHKDARGTGMVRMWGPNGLGNSEFLMWGHNGAAIGTTTTAVGTGVDGTIIKERLTRIWRVSESGGDVGTVNLSFDTDQIPGNFIGSNLRLLIDRDGDGFQDNDVTPVSGTYSSGKIIFSGINLQDGDRFTLGNTSSSYTLPITLQSFDAIARENDVLVTWKTASEIDNDHFDVERSTDAERWEIVGTQKGAGTTNTESTYQLVDPRPLEGRSYYRLKQVDYDGNYSLSNVVAVDFTRNDIILWPNPTTGIFNLTVSDVYVEVFDIQGKRLLSSRLEPSQTGVDISSQPAGIYVVKVFDVAGIRIFRLVKK